MFIAACGVIIDDGRRIEQMDGTLEDGLGIFS
jgi:hypothetical protein